MHLTPDIGGLCPIDDAGLGVVFGRRGGPRASAGPVLGNIAMVWVASARNVICGCALGLPWEEQ